MASSGFRFPPNVFSATESAVLQQAGLSVDTVSARSEMVGVGVFSDVWPLGGIRTWLQAAEPLVAISTNTADAASGVGAQELAIQGLDGAGLPIVETLPMNGTSLTVPTSASFMRLNDVVVSIVGVYGGVNAGDITVQTASSAIIQAYLETGRSRQEQSHVSVPSTVFAMAYGLNGFVQANQEAKIRILARFNAFEVAGNFSPTIILFEFPGVLGQIDFSIELPFRFNPLSDLWMTAQGVNPNTIITLSYGLLLVG